MVSLTTHAGDERPCQRCIKRGLQDACHDGVRKKAKYLHDAPSESLMPGVGLRGASNRFPYVPNLPRGPPLGHETTYPVSSAGGVYAPPFAVPTTFSMYASSGPPGGPMPMPMPLVDSVVSPPCYSAQVSPISPHFTPGSSNQASPMQSMAGVLRQTPQPTPNALESAYGPTIFDPNDPMQYNFDPASFNFGSTYGALEFGMLGHMSSGVVETSSGEACGPLSASGPGYTTPGGAIAAGYDGSPVNAQTFMYSPDHNLGDWPNDTTSSGRHPSGTPAFPVGGAPSVPLGDMMHPDVLHGYTIGTSPSSYTIGASPSSLSSSSPSPSPADAMARMDDGNHGGSRYSNSPAHLSAHDPSGSAERAPFVLSKPVPKGPNMSARRSRDPSSIYENVQQPYSYTDGFHGLTAFLQKRFTPQKTLRIAKALASIRPSFISCTKTLNRDDLIFMEKCFQRTLFEYEDFINKCGTPTIVCRRTGEVAAVGREFCLLTGWSKDVLLGNEPNRNVNTGHNVGSASAVSSRGGTSTPHGSGETGLEADDEARSKPVFLAELLDDDSVIEFYEDFARLAFGDSRGSVTRQCKLLKYKTAADYAAERDPTRNEMGGSRPMKPIYNGGPLGIHQLTGKDGKVECSYCWTVRRDVFDIPMLLVMNVSEALSFFGFPP